MYYVLLVYTYQIDNQTIDESIDGHWPVDWTNIEKRERERAHVENSNIYIQCILSDM